MGTADFNRHSARFPLRPPKLRALVADDHPVVRDEIVSILNGSPDVEVIAEAGDGAEAARVAIETRPDLVVLDVSMPRLNGAQAARLILNALPETRILVLTIHEEQEYVARMLDAGVSGYLLKDSAPYELLTAVRALAAGRSYFSSRVFKKLAPALQKR
jgi:DNA-binding NarL/FixJ family response regulator